MRWRLLVSGLLALLWLGLAATAPVAGAAEGETAEPDTGDRLRAIRAEMADSGVYLEPALAQGEVDLWHERLTKALKKADLGAPFKVALWVPIPGVEPLEDDDLDDRARLRQLGMGKDSVGLIDEFGSLWTVSDLPTGATARLRALEDRTGAVIRRVVAASPDSERYREMSPAAEVWILLRLAAKKPPAPQALIAELSGDTSLLVDEAPAPDDSDDDLSDLASPWAIVGAVGVMLVVVAVFVVTSRRTLTERLRDASKQPRRSPDPMIADLTPLAIEREVTDFAEEIARSDVRPGEAAYDRAQAHLDAANKYVDADAERDRVGCHLLVADGRLALAGESAPSRCFFHPMHTATTSVKRRKVALPCCQPCARAVTAGDTPAALMVTGESGVVAPYYETDDIWSATGYGAIDERWARRALLAALEGR